MKTAILSLLVGIPLFAAHPVAEPQLAPATYRSLRPATAFAGDRFLTVWTEEMDGLGRHIKGAFSDAAGRRVSPIAFTLVYDTGMDWSQLVGTGDAYVLFWRWRDTVRMADIDLDGRVVRTRVIDLPRFRHEGAAVSWNGSRFLVAMSFDFNYPGKGTEALLLDRDGEVVRRAIAITPGVSPSTIVPASDGFTLFSVNGDVYAHRIGNDGAVAPSLIDGSSGHAWSVVAVPIGGGELLVVWSEADGAGWSLRSAVVSDDLSTSPTTVIARADGQLRPVGLGRFGSGALLAYTAAPRLSNDPALVTVRLRADGAPAGAPSTVAAKITSARTASNDGGMLIVGNIDDTSFRRVSSIFVPISGEATATELLSIAYARQMQPLLTTVGGRLQATWTELIGDAAFVRTAILDATGKPIERNVITMAFLAAPTVPSNGTESLAVIHANDTLMAVRLDANGAALDPEPIVLGTVRHYLPWDRPASAAWVGNQWLVVWPQKNALLASTISRAGVASAPRPAPLPVLPPDRWRSVDAVTIGFDGTRVLLVAQETIHQFCSFPPCYADAHTFAARMTPDGELIKTAPLALPVTSASYSIASSGREFVAVAGNQAMTIDASGSALRMTANRAFFGSLSDVAWDGRDYVIASRYRLQRSHLTLRRADAALNETAPPRGTETLPAHTWEPPSIAVIDSARVAIGIEAGDADRGARAVVYLEDELSPLVAPPAAPTNVRIRPISATEYEVTWDAPPGEVEQYAIRQWNGRSWALVAVVPADVRSVKTTSALVRISAVNAGGASDWAPDYSRRRGARH